MRNKQTKKIPTFANREEEARFWETHSIADFQNELQPVKAKFAKNLSSGITIRFDPSTLGDIRTLAKERGIGPTTLIRMWILEQLRHTHSG